MPSLTVAGPGGNVLSGFVDLLVDEVNVKSVEFTDDLGTYARRVLQPRGSMLGPRLGGEVQAVFASARSGDWVLAEDGTAIVAGHQLSADEFDLTLESREGVTSAALASGNAVVVLDTTVTDDLAREGLARDVVRHVQQARRDADLVVTDRILLWLDGDATMLDAVRDHEGWVAGQVLATGITYGPADDAPSTTVAIEGAEVTLAFVVA